jgi:hypothetical protein
LPLHHHLRLSPAMSTASLETRLEEATVVFQKLQAGKSGPIDPFKTAGELRGPVWTEAGRPRSLSFPMILDYGKAVEARQRLDGQKSENEGVLKVSAAMLFEVDLIEPAGREGAGMLSSDFSSSRALVPLADLRPQTVQSSQVRTTLAG